MTLPVVRLLCAETIHVRTIRSLSQTSPQRCIMRARRIARAMHDVCAISGKWAILSLRRAESRSWKITTVIVDRGCWKCRRGRGGKATPLMHGSIKVSNFAFWLAAALKCNIAAEEFCTKYFPAFLNYFPSRTARFISRGLVCGSSTTILFTRVAAAWKVAWLLFHFIRWLLHYGVRPVEINSGDISLWKARVRFS